MMNDTDSGLGIGGHGSDDYNINTPEPVIPQPPAQPRRGFGAQVHVSTSLCPAL
jgi:hypothetical protein